MPLIPNPVEEFGTVGVEVPVPTVVEYIVPTNWNRSELGARIYCRVNAYSAYPASW